MPLLGLGHSTLPLFLDSPSWIIIIGGNYLIFGEHLCSPVKGPSRLPVNSQPCEWLRKWFLFHSPHQDFSNAQSPDDILMRELEWERCTAKVFLNTWFSVMMGLKTACYFKPISLGVIYIISLNRRGYVCHKLIVWDVLRNKGLKGNRWYIWGMLLGRASLRHFSKDTKENVFISIGNIKTAGSPIKSSATEC